MRVIDSHTAGEPTRVILDGGPDLGEGPISERAKRLEADFPDFAASIVAEPRGKEAMVGALLLPPSEPECAAGVIYFNAAGNLGMCGHASIGTMVTLAYLKRASAGRHRIETPVGIVEAELHSANSVSIDNVESYRLAKDVVVNVAGLGECVGDIAWGGNWFFLVHDAPAPLLFENVVPLTQAALQIRQALVDACITGADGAYIDHVEFKGPPQSPTGNARNFVLCPDNAYDRSPCGTGSSAKVACLAADGLLKPGEKWVQESIIGSTYSLTYRPGTNGGVLPTVTGNAYVVAEANLVFDPHDPYRTGIA